MDRNILSDISLILDRGDFLIILGSNGSGKSSLLKCLNGTIRPTSGRVWLGGKELTTLYCKKYCDLGAKCRAFHLWRFDRG